MSNQLSNGIQLKLLIVQMARCDMKIHQRSERVGQCQWLLPWQQQGKAVNPEKWWK